jgi:hypothetical protein
MSNEGGGTMLKSLKIRRAAAKLVDAFPEIPVDVARARASRMVETYPHIGTDRVAEYLIHGERIAIFFEEALSRTGEEAA